MTEFELELIDKRTAPAFKLMVNSMAGKYQLSLVNERGHSIQRVTADNLPQLLIAISEAVHANREMLAKKMNDSLKASALALRAKGRTIRQIAKSLGFKHPGSISHLLKN